MRVFIKTFGCRTNIYDSELIRGYLKQSLATLVNDENEASVVLINGCTVTNSADNTLLAYIRHIKSSNPQARIILTGCAAASNGARLYEEGLVDGVLGASAKASVASLLAKNERFFEQGDLKFVDKSNLNDYEQHTKAFIKIQEGCDFACSYCIIPSVRGKSRSIATVDILEQIARLSSNGYSEFVLTGTNMGSYGKEFGSSLGKLLAKIGKIPGVKRVRLGSLESAQIDESFLELIAEPWLERHLHIALQHTHAHMLKLMRRRNKALEDLELFLRLAEAGYALGTDFIVAHPGESEEIWTEAVQNFKRYPITHLHAFIYSERANTHSVELAKRLGKIDLNTAKARLNEIKQIATLNNFNFRKAHKDSALEVLIEQKKGAYWCGYDQFFNQLKIKSDKNLAKRWLSVDKYLVLEEGNLKEDYE